MRIESNALPISTHYALELLGAKLMNGDPIDEQLALVLDRLGSLPPEHIARVDVAIASVAKLSHRSSSMVARAFGSPTDYERLLRTPGLEYLFLFHRDGRLREAALLKITGGLPTPFLYAAVLWRLNDWAAPVRAAAVRCAQRSFRMTDANVAAKAIIALVRPHVTWGRWTDERGLFDAAFSRPDVAERLADLFRTGANGPLASVLRYSLRSPALDPHLPAIALEACQPAVRAVALDVMISGKASWPDSREWQWIDKSMGLGSWVPVFEHRPLVNPPPRAELIERACATDRRPSGAWPSTHLSATVSEPCSPAIMRLCF